MAEAARVGRFASTSAIDLRRTLGVLGRGRFDPCARWDGDRFWRASNTPVGPVTTCVQADPAATAYVIEAWGAGAAWMLDHGAGLLGLHDDPGAFATGDPVVAALARRCPGLRLTRAGTVHDIAMATIVEQRVTSIEARRTWNRIVGRHGQPAPGPVALRLPPDPARVASLSDSERHLLGLETRRGRTLSVVAAEAGRLDRVVDVGGALEPRLLRLPGVGPWTAAHVAHLVQGDADAVPTGDWHLPGIVAFTLAGEERADDARMLELLEPFRPHRGRVLRLITIAGRRPPRRAPRAEILDPLGRERRGDRNWPARRGRARGMAGVVRRP